MLTTRRVFLEMIGPGAAASALAMGCGGMLAPAAETDGGTLDPGTGMGGAAGTGGGTGGASENTGGAAGTSSGGAAGTSSGGAAGAPTAAGTGGSAGAGQGAGGTTTLGPRDVLAGGLSRFAVGTIVVVGQNVAVGRDVNGLYALTIICTHQGCQVAPGGAGAALRLICPCHGSQFDANGAVVRGPASRPLVHYAVEVDAAGNVIVHTAVQVPAAARVAA
jgi:cytochrome b6-f complex iron-sulfur subunit